MGATATATVSISPVSSLNQAFILAPAGQMSVGRGSGGAQQNATEVLVRATLSATNQVTLNRGAATGDSSYSFFVVEDTSGNEIYVKSGSQAFAAADATFNINVGAGISDYTKTVIFLTVSSGSGSVSYYHQAHVRGKMTSNTNLELSRTGGNAAINVDWFVVEFKGSGWSVQQGDFALTNGTQATPQSQTISAVTMANTFVFMNWSATTNGLDQVSAEVELYNSTTLRFSRQDTTSGTCNVHYFVVSHSSLTVQRGSAYAAGGASALSQPITQVNPLATFPVTFNDCNGTGSAFPRPYWRAWFSSSTALDWDRSYTGQDSNFFWQVIDLSGFATGAATFAANEDTKLTGVLADTTYRVRFEVANKGDQSSGGVTYQLQVAETGTCGSGSYSAVPTDSSGHWQIAGSTFITDGEATANISPGLTDEASTFVSGQLKDAGNTTGSITLNANEFTEIEFAVKATSNANPGGDYCFRLYDTAGGKTLDTYSVYAQVQLASGTFAYRKPITLADSMTPSSSCSSNLSSFPLLVSYTDATLKTVANGGHVENANGYDIIFRAEDSAICTDSGNPVPCTLDHEIEKYDGSTGALVAWVRIPTLAYNADKTIYMYYGNNAITSATANPTAVWDSSYVGVWHLSESSGSGYYLSNSKQANYYANAGSTTYLASPVGFSLDGARDFNNSYCTVQNGGSLFNGDSAFTLELWAYPDYATDATWVEDSFEMSDSLNLCRWFRSGDPANKAHVQCDVNWSGGTTDYFSAASALTRQQWNHIVLTYDGAYLRWYVNGSQATSLARASRTLTTNSYAYFGNNAGIDSNFDEYRYSRTARDACWIATEANNQGAYATYVTVGAEQAAPTAVELIDLRAVAQSDGRVLVSWRTGFEVDNLGFHVYREVGGARVRVTRGLVAGSALFAGAGTALTAGRSYSWWDPSPVAGASYWLEEWDLSGAKRWHGPVQPGQAEAQALAMVPSAPLAGLGAPPTQSPTRVVRRQLPALGVPTGDRVAMQWWVAGQPAVKFLVREEGWCRVSQEELAMAGFDPEGDSQRLQLFTDGQEVPVVVDGEPKGRLVPGDAIEFYGVGLDTLSTDARVYWLVAGTRRGLRLREESGRGRWSPGPASFPYEVERADRTIYVPSLLNGDEDNFFGAVVTTTPVERAVRVQHLAPDGEAVLTVRLQGGTQVSHRVGVELNGARVGTVTWEGIQAGELVVPLGPGMVREGDNVVTLTAEGAEEDVSAVDFIRLRYPHTWEAESDALRFTIKGFQKVDIGGFASAQVSVFDVTDPMRVVEVSAEVVKDGEAYRVRVGVPEAGTRTMLAVGQGAVRHPAALVANNPSMWHAATSAADLVIIAHRSVLPAVEPLRALRERQGLKVAVVDVEDVHDEFSFGAKSPQAIRDFLACALTSWSRPPRYLLLVGDASYDPRNYLGFGDLDLVPTKLVDTKYMETASDDWFADFDGDGIGDISVGRLPVQTPGEAAAVVAKIVAYEGAAAIGRVLLVADANDEENDFEGLSGRVKAVVPSSMTVAEVYRGQLGDGAARGELASQLELGQTLINYIGHGSVGEWRGLITTEDVRGFEKNSPAFWAPMTCLNGFFHDPQEQSMAEALLEAPGGALAVWASSGLTESGAQIPMDEALMNLLYTQSGPTPTLGDAACAAKVATTDMDVRRTWILFGDPTTRLRR